MTCTMVEFKSATPAEARLLINQTAVVSLLLSLFPLSLAESASTSRTHSRSVSLVETCHRKGVSNISRVLSMRLDSTVGVSRIF